LNKQLEATPKKCRAVFPWSRTVDGSKIRRQKKPGMVMKTSGKFNGIFIYHINW